MTRAAQLATLHPKRSWAALAACALAAALAAAAFSYVAQLRERQRLLEVNIQRSAIETMALTLDGKLMGAVSMLGLLNTDIKQDSLNAVLPNDPALLAMMASVGAAYDAHGVFVAGQDGKVRTSWDSAAKSATGIDVSFRPYFQLAMQGRDSVYAAVSLSRGERALFFTAPIYPGTVRGGAPVGAVAARTDMRRLDGLLARAGHVAVLLSPGGVVFASSRREWLGAVTAPATPERLARIAAQRQFPGLFDPKQPRLLPLAPVPGIVTLDGAPHALAVANVNWNDPAGQWRLLVLEDLSRTVQPASCLPAALAAAAATLLLGGLLLRLLRTQAAQRASAREVERLARESADRAERKMQLAQAALSLQRADGAAAVAQAFLAECQRLFGALQGVVYGCAQDGGPLRLTASHACHPAPATSVAQGDGLLGECARERRPRLIDTAAGGAPWTIRSALGGMAPAALMLAPVLLQSRLLGVVEVALPARPGAHDMEQFLAAVELLAINLETARRHSGAAPKEEACPDHC